MSGFTDGRGVEALRDDISGLLECARGEMNAAAAAFVFVHGGCGGDCSSHRAENEVGELAASFSTAMAKAVFALAGIPSEVDALIKACGVKVETTDEPRLAHAAEE